MTYTNRIHVSHCGRSLVGRGTSVLALASVLQAACIDESAPDATGQGDAPEAGHAAAAVIPDGGASAPLGTSPSSAQPVSGREGAAPNAARPLQATDAGHALWDAQGESQPARPASVADGGDPPDSRDAGDGGPQNEGGAREAGASVVTSCTSKPGTKKGKTQETISVGGAMRKFVMHRPTTLDADKPAPIVIVPHGYTQTGDDMYRITKYWEIGEKEGIVTLYPEGASFIGPWNVGQPSCQSVYGLLPLGSGNDQAFLDAMVKFVEADQCVDRDHVFIAGFSMGAYFANAAACQNDLIRAIAPHSGGSHDLSACQGKRKPVIMFHGNGDQLIPYNCGKETRQRWVKRNGCSTEVEVKPITNGSCEYHKGCPADGQVAFCTLNDMNHGWAGGPTEQVVVYPDNYPKFESSTQVSWEFFKKYAW